MNKDSLVREIYCQVVQTTTGVHFSQTTEIAKATPTLRLKSALFTMDRLHRIRNGKGVLERGTKKALLTIY